jgi:hypothetical protein
VNKASDFKEQELLLNIYAHALSSQMSKKLDINITPYFSHSYAQTGPDDTYLTFDMYLLKGRPNIFSLYRGECVLKSTIDTKHTSVWVHNKKTCKPVILSNHVTFYERNDGMPSKKTLFEIVKDTSDDFALKADLRLVTEIPQRHIENILLYKRA